MNMPFIEARDGTPLYYKDWGAGPPVVLVHGWPLNADMWEYQARVLAASGHRVIAYDRRGFGRSGQPWAGYDYDTLASDLACVIDALDLRHATLVGFSMGGGEVVRYLATQDAARVSRAVLVSSVVPFLLKTPDNPSGVDRPVFDAMVQGLEADRPAFLETFGKKFFGAGLLNFSVSSAILQWASMMALQASPKATLDCVRAFSETDFRQDCSRIAIPTLIIHGTGDQTVPPASSSEEAAKRIAGSTLITYEGAPHALFYTERDRLNQDLLRFLA
jgi:pimeloyl-ACP methyl ester carboxylesterase